MPGEQLRISVVIPTFQRRDQVQRAIDSAVDQSVAPAEVFVVDDGSTDGTAEAVGARYGEEVRLLRQPNQGPAAARNAGIDAASGDVVAFLDSDDRWLPHHLAVVSELFTRHPTAVLVGTYRNLRQGGDDPSTSALEDLAKELLLCITEVGLPTGVAVQRAAVQAAGGFDVRFTFVQDNDLFVRLALVGPFAVISATTFERTIHEDSHGTQGLQSGGFVDYYERNAEKVLALLETCARPDVDELRAAARARRALGASVRMLLEGAPADAIRPHLDEMKWWAPELDAEAAVVDAAKWIAPGWRLPENRHRVVTLLRLAAGNSSGR